MNKIYRIISLESLLSLLLTSQDRLVRPIDSWPDTYEGYLFRMIEQHGDKTREVIDRIYHDVSEESVERTIANLAKLLRCRYTCYCMCWSKKDDSDALWRIYSYGKKAIQLESTREKVMSVLDNAHFEKGSYSIVDVKYEDSDELLTLSKLLEPDSKIYDSFVYKRTAFRHEEEVRVIVNNVYDWDERESELLEEIRELFNNSKGIDIGEKLYDAICLVNIEKYYKKGKEYNSCALKIKDIKDYLDGVRVHPEAEDWYVNLVHNLCLEYKVPFLGQSKLYKGI